MTAVQTTTVGGVDEITVSEQDGTGSHPKVDPRVRQLEVVWWVAFCGNAGLAALQICMGALGYSPLLVIAGLYASGIAVVAMSSVLGVRMDGSPSRGDGHAYGKGKAEFLVGLLLGCLLMASGAAVVGLAIRALFGPPVPIEPVALGLAISVVATVSGYALLRFYQNRGGAAGEPSLHELARLQLVGVGSSVVMAQSLVLTAMGWTVAQQLGSLSVGGLVLWLAFRVMRRSIDGVLDRRSSPEIEEFIRRLVAEVEYVEDVDQVRTRRVGAKVHVDLHVRVDRQRTVREWDEIDERIRNTVTNKTPQPTHVVSIECSTA
jgi:cation diffusion facilitator family transporter